MKKIRTQSSISIGVIGLGYVGLPLCLQFAETGARVTGFDIDAEKIRLLKAGKSYIKHISSQEITRAFPLKKQKKKSGKGFAENQNHLTTDFSKISGMDVVIVCVPTPLSKGNQPDLSYVLSTSKSLAPYLKQGALVVLESTTYPGTTEEEMRAILEKYSGKKAGVDFHLAYSPERVDPGNSTIKSRQLPKVVSGLTPTCLSKAKQVYGKITDQVVPVSSCRAAEATKLLENIFRSVNIALVNELKGVYEAMGVDIWEVIHAAKTKPFGFMPFYPGPGLGGHCIPIDPFYLSWKAAQCGTETRFIELAGEINTAMPKKVVAKLEAALRRNKQRLKGAKILIVGLAYKPDVDDDRESPSYVLMDLVTRKGAKASYFDPHVPIIKMTREHGHWAGTKSIRWNRNSVGSFDAAIIVTPHQAISFKELGAWSSLIIDTRNAMAGIKTKARVVKA